MSPAHVYAYFAFRRERERGAKELRAKSIEAEAAAICQGIRQTVFIKFENTIYNLNFIRFCKKILRNL